MHRPFNFLHPEIAPTLRESSSIRVMPRTEVQWGGPVFRAPALRYNRPPDSAVLALVNFPLKTRPAH